MFFKFSLSPTQKQYACVQCANLSLICLGMSITWPSPIVIKLSDKNQKIISQPITDAQAAWITSIGYVLAVCAFFLSGILVDRVGRKRTLMLTYVPRIIFCIITLSLTEYWMVLLARAFAGVADMVTLSAVSTYNSEIASKSIRGSSGTLTQSNSAFGMLIMFAIGPYVSYMSVNIMVTCIYIACFIPLMFVPETPFFLYSKGETSKSLEVLIFLYGSEEEANEELQGFASTSTEQVQNKWAVLKDRTNLKTLVMTFLLSVGLQLNGYNAVNLYLQTIFELAKTSVSSEISSLIIGLVQFFVCFVAFFLMNRFGRKPIICTSLVAMLVGLVGLGTFFTLMEHGTTITGFLNYLPLISVAIVIIGYNAGVGSIIWMVVAELLDSPIRAYGMSMAICTTYLTVFCVIVIFPTLNATIGASGIYWLFSVGTVLEILFVMIFVPETKDKSFAQIQAALGRKDVVDSNNLKDIGNESNHKVPLDNNG